MVSEIPRFTHLTVSDFVGSIPLDTAWDFIYQNTTDSNAVETFRELFPDNSNRDYFEERQFSELHQAVLGLNNKKMASELSVNNVDIDARDSHGRTALIWAAMRRDTLGLDLLLQAQADPNACDQMGKTALIYAASSADLDSLKLLLGARADASLCSTDGLSALHYAARSNNNREAIECLVAAGIDPNIRYVTGNTALSCAAFNDNFHAAAALIDLGADVNLADNEGDVPLFKAIFYQSANVVELFLRCGAHYTAHASDGSSVLHLAMATSNTRILDSLRLARLEEFDPEAVDRQRMTPIQLARQRHGECRAFMEKAESLLVDIRDRQAASKAGAHRGDSETHRTSLSLDGHDSQDLTVPSALCDLFQRYQHKALAMRSPGFGRTLEMPKLVHLGTQSQGWLIVFVIWTLGCVCGGIIYLWANAIPTSQGNPRMQSRIGES